MVNKEASARIKINKLLEESGWRFFDSDEGRANVQLEAGTKVTKQKLDELGNDFENSFLALPITPASHTADFQPLHQTHLRSA